MLLYADEDFTCHSVIAELRGLGHDVLAAQEDGRRATPDHEILARAHSLSRVVVTHNRRHFRRLHSQGEPHSGIVAATQDPGNHQRLAARVHAELHGRARVDGSCA
jgi:predicted nuclease of predicted toxin-antitoxin system